MLAKYPALMTPEQAAEFLVVSKKTVMKKLKAGEITPTRIGKFYRVRKEDLELYLLRSRTVEAQKPVP